MTVSQYANFSPPLYKARNLLAALDFNMHIDLPALKKKGTDEDQ
jgi:hypothetical protein